MLTIAPPPLSPHAALLHPAERAEHVDVEHLAGSTEIECLQRPVRGIDADVVDQRGDRPERAQHGVHDRSPVVGVVALAGHADRDVRATQIFGGGLQRGGVAAGDAHLGAHGDQPLGDREADSPARPGHDRHLLAHAAAPSRRPISAILEL
jgi:hypothetical protein